MVLTIYHLSTGTRNLVDNEGCNLAESKGSKFACAFIFVGMESGGHMGWKTLKRLSTPLF